MSDERIGTVRSAIVNEGDQHAGLMALDSLQKELATCDGLMREAFDEDGWPSRLVTSGSDQGHELRDRIVAARGTG